MEREKMIHLKFSFRLISKDNEKIFNRQGRPFLSAKFKAFAEQVKWEAKSQYKGKPLEGNLLVQIGANFKDRRHCDLFNLPKGLCDALNGIAWIDDRQIKNGQVLVKEGEKDDFEICIIKYP